MVAGSHKKERGGGPKKGTRAAPRFPHLSAERGQQLRAEWIAKQKIKNAYKALTRKGEGQPSEGLEEEVLARDDEHNDGEEPASETLVAPLSPETAPPPSRKRARSPQSQLPSHTSSKLQPHSRTPAAPPAQSTSKGKGKGKGKARDAPQSTSTPTDDPAQKSLEEKERIRNLFKDAYSPSSLHSFKSDPLHRRRDGSGRGRGSSGRGRGAGSGRGGPPAGRGQPDMRKRMGALLAQIESQTAS